jgi:hypothetical protein
VRYQRLILPIVAVVAACATAGAGARQLEGLHFSAALSGAQMIPELDTRAAAVARVSFDPGFTEIRLAVETTTGFQATGAQLHCGFAGEDGPMVVSLMNPGPLAGLREGAPVTLRQPLVHGSGCQFQIGRQVNNVAALAFAMREGLVYITLGTREYPQGELRGQFLSIAEIGELELPDDRLSAPFPR